MNDEGIILAIQKFRDTDIIARWICRENGRMDTLARNARRPDSPFHGRIDLYHCCQIQTTAPVHSQLHVLKECRLVSHAGYLGRSLLACEAMAAAASLVESITEKNTPIPKVYEYFHQFIRNLDQACITDLERYYTQFEVQFLLECGVLSERLPEAIALRTGTSGQWVEVPDFARRLELYSNKHLIRQQLSPPLARARFFNHLIRAQRANENRQQEEDKGNSGR